MPVTEQNSIIKIAPSNEKILQKFSCLKEKKKNFLENSFLYGRLDLKGY